jgi:hypothetical protein
MQYLKASAITLKYFLKVMRVRVDTIQHFHASKYCTAMMYSSKFAAYVWRARTYYAGEYRQQAGR